MRYAIRRPANGISIARLLIVSSAIAGFFLVILTRLFFIQVIQHSAYKARADRQHFETTDVSAHRGEIYAHDHTNESSDTLYVLAANKKFFEVYLNPSEITRPVNIAETLSEILGVDYATALARAEKSNDIYEPVKTRVPEEKVRAIQQAQLPGIHFREEVWRYYPDGASGSHLVGFYGIKGDEKSGQYGIEGYWDAELRGRRGEIVIARDAHRTIIPDGTSAVAREADGADLLLTADRTIQFEVCKILKAGIERFGADTGTAIVMESQTGKILAMCGYPSFDPNRYNEVADVSYFNNGAVFEAYEPGSVMKPIAMAIAIDRGVVTPETTYVDTGEASVADRVIRNFDKKAHGLKTMTEVLELSLNTGIIFATKQVPNDVFFDYIKKFGFGAKTNIEISQEVEGSLGALSSGEEIYKATASFGQGLTVTPLQLLMGINVIANGGTLLKPIIVDEVRASDGSVTRSRPVSLRQVISPRTAQTVAAMLVSAVDQGQLTKARVEGYYVAGKSGTAEIAEQGKYGDKTNHTFVGFAPVNDPKFTALIKMSNVKNVRFAADTTAPMFGEIARFLLQYYKIPPNR